MKDAIRIRKTAVLPKSLFVRAKVLSSGERWSVIISIIVFNISIIKRRRRVEVRRSFSNKVKGIKYRVIDEMMAYINSNWKDNSNLVMKTNPRREKIREFHNLIMMEIGPTSLVIIL